MGLLFFTMKVCLRIKKLLAAWTMIRHANFFTENLIVIDSLALNLIKSEQLLRNDHNIAKLKRLIRHTGLSLEKPVDAQSLINQFEQN